MEKKSRCKYNIRTARLHQSSDVNALMNGSRLNLNANIHFCLIEGRAMVVAIQQPLAESTVIFTVCIV